MNVYNKAAIVQFFKKRADKLKLKLDSDRH